MEFHFYFIYIFSTKHLKSFKGIIWDMLSSRIVREFIILYYIIKCKVFYSVEGGKDLCVKTWFSFQLCHLQCAVRNSTIRFNFLIYWGAVSTFQSCIH